MKMKYTGLVISDVHVGAFDINKLNDEYQKIFIDYIKSLDKLDFLIIDGDFFHHKFYLNDKESVMAYYMLQSLFDVCKPLNTKIRIVYGTESHECNQYDILSVVDLYDDIKIIKTVTKEDLFDDLRVLYIPEEYTANKDEFYKDYFNERYDYVFGHGVIKEGMETAVAHMKANGTDKRKKVPIFTSGELSSICDGEVYFGHYHINTEIDDTVFYVGSFSRWEFGQEGRKGFYEISCNPENMVYNHRFIENTLADVFVTISYGYNSAIYNDDSVNNIELDRTLSNVDKKIDDKIFEHVRFEFNIPSTCNEPEGLIQYIKERYKFNDKVKVNFVNGYVEEKKAKKKEIVKKENEEFDFIYDNNIPIPDKISQFIVITYNENIPTENISSYLNDEVDEILSKVSETSE